MNDWMIQNKFSNSRDSCLYCCFLWILPYAFTQKNRLCGRNLYYETANLNLRQAPRCVLEVCVLVIKPRFNGQPLENLSISRTLPSSAMPSLPVPTGARSQSMFDYPAGEVFGWLV